jgi:YggT family protein
MTDALAVTRYVVFVAFGASVLVALAAWLVRTRRVSPFSVAGRALRAMSDPLIHPVETRLVRAGGSPVNAGWWLVVFVAAIGVILIAALNWLADVASGVIFAFSGGPRAGLALLIVLVYRVLVAALFVRVIAGWLGYHRYARWLRPVYALTDWVVEPLRRVLPPFGRFDWSPLAAWLVLMLLQRVLLLGLAL